MNKSLLLASLVAAVALAACGKKEEALRRLRRACRCRRLPPCRRRCLAAAAAGRLGRRCRCVGCRCVPTPPLPRRKAAEAAASPPQVSRRAAVRRTSGDSQTTRPPSGGFFAWRCDRCARRLSASGEPVEARAPGRRRRSRAPARRQARGQRRARQLGPLFSLLRWAATTGCSRGVQARARGSRPRCRWPVAVAAADARLERRR